MSLPDTSAPFVRDAVLADVPALDRCYGQASHAERIRTADGKNRRYLVVEVAGEVVGFGRLFLEQPPDAHRFPYAPRICNLNVRPDMRGRGLATLLIREMERLALAAGHRVLYLGVNKDNATALSLYRRLGYEPIPGPLLQDAPSPVSHGKRRAPVLPLMKALTPATPPS